MIRMDFPSFRKAQLCLRERIICGGREGSLPKEKRFLFSKRKGFKVKPETGEPGFREVLRTPGRPGAESGLGRSAQGWPWEAPGNFCRLWV